MTNKSGFEPLPEGLKLCIHPEHEPPNFLCIPPDSQYRHVCPGCNTVVYIRPCPVRMESSQPTFSKGYSDISPLDSQGPTYKLYQRGK